MSSQDFFLAVIRLKNQSSTSSIVRGLRILNWNAYVLKPHLFEEERLPSEEDPDIVCISETFVSPAKKIFVLGFSTYRFDRAYGWGGGVIILVSFTNSHTHSPIFITDSAVGVDITHSKGDTMLK